MDRKTFYKITLQTVLPLMLQSLLTSCVNFIDQIMVGTLGVAEIAAVGVATNYIPCFIWCFMEPAVPVLCLSPNTGAKRMWMVSGKRWV